jgi:alginate O-acetyltransferase complex protein AlgI
MLFNSHGFIFVFLPLAFIGLFCLGRRSHCLAALWMGLASLVFYAVWDYRFVSLLLASVAFNYGAGYWLGRINSESRKKKLLVFAVGGNLMLLAYFKYTNFFFASINQFFGSHLPTFNIILPLGISFFTFTQIAFLVDVSRGIAREYNFIHYLLFVTYFPHLIAGPVLHHKQMMPQFADPATFHVNRENIAAGLTVFVIGLSKKVLIADNLAGYAALFFNAARDNQALTFFEGWTGALAYTLQLYFDFSGYSDMAIGMSLLFNVRLPLNFNSPYKATSVADFWRRWHMTLSAFLRDYIYFPLVLGGNRNSRSRPYFCLFITMLLAGLWHGAGWTFIVWGGLLGLYLMINQGWREIKSRFGLKNGGAFSRLASSALTFFAIVVSWVFFRANNLGAARSMLKAMAGLNGMSLPSVLKEYFPEFARLAPDSKFVFAGFLPLLGNSRNPFIAIGLCLVLVWLFPNTREIMRNHKITTDDTAGIQPAATGPRGWIAEHMTWTPTPAKAVVVAVLFMICVISLKKFSEFLYFQF